MFRIIRCRAQEREAKAKRRIGLGVTGLADALIMCRVRYGKRDVRGADRAVVQDDPPRGLFGVERVAAEKGSFPLFDREKYLATGRRWRELDAGACARAIALHGMRNALLTSIAPTGTISLLAENVSSGIEPVFAYSYKRKITKAGGERSEEKVEDYAYRLLPRAARRTARCPTISSMRRPCRRRRISRCRRRRRNMSTARFPRP